MFAKTTSPLEKKRADAVRSLIGLLDGKSGVLSQEGDARAQAIEICAAQVARYEAALKGLRSLGQLTAKRAG